MYAIIEEGGKQFRVTGGDEILIDREATPDLKNITFDRVLLVGGEGSPKIGTPLVGGATVSADVVGPEKGPKVRIVKYKRRKHWDREPGHRQKDLRVKITGINA